MQPEIFAQPHDCLSIMMVHSALGKGISLDLPWLSQLIFCPRDFLAALPVFDISHNCTYKGLSKLHVFTVFICIYVFITLFISASTNREVRMLIVHDFLNSWQNISKRKQEIGLLICSAENDHWTWVPVIEFLPFSQPGWLGVVACVKSIITLQVILCPWSNLLLLYATRI